MDFVDLDAKQDKLWQETRAALNFKCPAFTHIFYSLLVPDGAKHLALFTKDVPVAATDGSALMFNPDTFFKLNLYERLFVTAHEIMHCVYNHCGLGYQLKKSGKVRYSDGKALEYNHELMNAAMDFVINDALVTSKVGVMPKEGCYDPNIATHMDSFTDAYRKIYKKNNGKGGGFVGFDVHLDPGASKGKDPTSAAADRNEQEWQVTVQAAVNAAKAQGKLPAELERLLTKVLDPKIEWREHIQALFARRLGSGSYDWRRPDRRLIVQDIYAPGRSGFGAEFVVVGIDTSGSITQPTLDAFVAEVSGILEDVRPKRLAVIMCDARINKIHELDNAADLRTIKLVGGGGTDFRPVFDWVAKEGVVPDAMVYLTDGLGPFPGQSPNYPVIWGNVPSGAKYPFGDVVDIPQQAA